MGCKKKSGKGLVWVFFSPRQNDATTNMKLCTIYSNNSHIQIQYFLNRNSECICLQKCAYFSKLCWKNTIEIPYIVSLPITMSVLPASVGTLRRNNTHTQKFKNVIFLGWVGNLVGDGCFSQSKYANAWTWINRHGPKCEQLP